MNQLDYIGKLQVSKKESTVAHSKKLNTEWVNELDTKIL